MIGVDDFALRRRHRYATIIINAEAGDRLDVLPDREAATARAVEQLLNWARAGFQRGSHRTYRNPRSGP